MKKKELCMYALLAVISLLVGCSNASKPQQELEVDSLVNADSMSLRPLVMPGGDTVMVGVRTDSATIYRQVHDRKQCFIVISKKLLRLSVYEVVGGDTLLTARYPVCLSKNKGNKQRKGDMRTPESPKGKPFSIVQIQDASTWSHDFHDGRGSIKAYGHWFLRLLTPGHSGIGIHGSTNNEQTVPGRASEGCIRLLDKDIIDLKERYAFEGMNVTIQAENDDPLPFEK